ncbi:hypothetical protein BEN49_14145 [Hymenobacter coccineus]|uniref:Uncharacterized protein n=1 Tax=Hymenobacter coccineus TaxID=1908235 RepID=A0A1G1SUI2_9BACT|nr:hypothetical protein BEN49_14145 [Hymenobacter coccineus]
MAQICDIQTINNIKAAPMFELIAYALFQLFSITGAPAQGANSLDGGSGGWSGGIVASKGGSGGWSGGIVAPTSN